MCGPGFLRFKYDKDDPSTWKHFQTAEQKSTEEGRNTNPFYTEDGRYDSLSGREFAIQTQRGGQWGTVRNDMSPKMQQLGHIASLTVPSHKIGENTFFGGYGRNETVWQEMQKIDQEWDHKDRLAEIKSRYSKPSVAGSGGSGRGYSSSTRSGRGSAPSNGLGITTGDIISNRGST